MYVNDDGYLLIIWVLVVEADMFSISRTYVKHYSLLDNDKQLTVCNDPGVVATISLTFFLQRCRYTTCFDKPSSAITRLKSLLNWTTIVNDIGTKAAQKDHLSATKLLK